MTGQHTQDGPLFNELHGLVMACLEGAATAEQCEQLDDLVHDNPEARRLYVQYLNDSMCLRCIVSTPREKEIGPVRLSTDLGNTPYGAAGYLSSGWPVAYLVATVIFGIALLIGSLVPVSQPVQVAEQSLPMTKRPSAPEPQMESVGRITGMVDCQWEGSGFRVQGSELPSPAERGAGGEGGSDGLHPSSLIPHPSSRVSLGDTFALASGLLEITYDAGAKVILQGPVTYEVESAAGGYLSVGKLTARLEKDDKRGMLNAERSSSSSSFIIHRSSFAVRTPTATVTDMGTEFGVEVQPSGTTSASVFRGIIEVQPIACNGQRSQAIRLSENQAARVEKDSGGAGFVVRHIVADSAAFVRSEQLPKLAEEVKLTPFRRWQAYSQELRRDPSLLAYYDFQLEEGKPAVLRNVAVKADRSLDGVVENATWTTGRMIGKHALLFQNPSDYVQINLPQQVDDLTLAAWINVESINADYAGLLMSDGWNKRPGLVHWQLRADGRVGFAVCWGLNFWQSRPGFDRQRFARWTHLAAVYDHVAACVRFYLNGQMTDETRIQKHVPICIGPAQIGLASMWTPPRSFHGRIDEMAIFGRPLKSDEIQPMFEAGKPAGVGDISVHSDNK